MSKEQEESTPKLYFADHLKCLTLLHIFLTKIVYLVAPKAACSARDLGSKHLVYWVLGSRKISITK